MISAKQCTLIGERIPVIDLFAGPGGLGEGFEAFCSDSGKFKIVTSVECDTWAHRTLELRSFFRQFPKGKGPREYYQYLRGEICREALFDYHPEQAAMARQIARLGRLGDESTTPAATVDEWIQTGLGPKRRRGPWLLIGGPPCQAYSLVGRARRTNESRETFEKDERHFLYREYLRILKKHRPSVFVMENVKGILSARHGETQIFGKICDDLSGAGYELHGLCGLPVRDSAGNWMPDSFVIHAEEHGIPQTRHRVFIIGVQRGLGLVPLPLPNQAVEISVKRAIRGLPKLWSGISRRGGGSADWVSARDRGMNLAGVAASPGTNSRVHGSGGNFVAHSNVPDFEYDWFYDPKLGGSVNHEARTHMADDISRYAFAAAFAKNNGRSPAIQEFPSTLTPAHRNLDDPNAIIPFADRFRVQTADRPASTVTCHISKDGHYYIHPDPLQARSLTVREAARIQTFPDNYFFEGPRTEQYKQVGNAVPPLLAKMIAGVVLDLLNQMR